MGADHPEQSVKSNIDVLSPRYQRALSIILEQAPDIVTVQECDRTKAFTEMMTYAGYECRFNEKTASAATRDGDDYRKAHPEVKEGDHMDNVGIFWNKRTFQEVYGPRKIFLPNSKSGGLEGMGKQAAMWMLLRNKVTRICTRSSTSSRSHWQ